MNTTVTNQIDIFLQKVLSSAFTSESPFINVVTPLSGKFFTKYRIDSSNDKRANYPIQQITFRVGTPINFVSKNHLFLRDYFFFSLDDAEDAIIAGSPFRITKHDVFLNNGKIKRVHGIQFSEVYNSYHIPLVDIETEQEISFSLEQKERINAMCSPLFLQTQVNPYGEHIDTLVRDTNSSSYENASENMKELVSSSFLNFVFCPPDCGINVGNHYVFVDPTPYYKTFSHFPYVSPIL